MALSAIPLSSVAEASGEGPKGPKAGQCSAPDVLVCHLKKQGYRPICVPEDQLGDHIGNPAHGEDVLADADGDGSLSDLCVSSGADCDDSDANNFPGNAEICDGQDNNCDGVIDECDTGFSCDPTTASCEDAVAPTAICLVSLSIELDSGGNAAITASDVDAGSTDNVGIASRTLDRSSFTSADLGTNTVTLTVFDAAGNFDTCTTVVLVLEMPN